MTTHHPAPHHSPEAETTVGRHRAGTPQEYPDDPTVPTRHGNMYGDLDQTSGAPTMTVHHLAPPPRPRHLPPWLEQEPVEVPRPRAVNVAAGLWLVAVAIGAVSVALTLVDLEQVRAAILADVTRQLPGEAAGTRDRVAAAVLGIVIGGGALIMLLQLTFALGLRAGKRWARVALVLIGLIGVGYGLVAVGAVPQPVLVGGTAAATVGGAIAMFLPVSTRWLKSGGRR